MKVQLVTPYRVSHLQRYGATVRGKAASVYPQLDMSQHPHQRPTVFTPKENVGCSGSFPLPYLTDCLEILDPHPLGTLRACPGL